MRPPAWRKTCKSIPGVVGMVVEERPPQSYTYYEVDMKSTYQMRILQLLQHLDIVQLDVQELVDGFEGALDGDVVFELDGDLVVDEGFEETVGVGGLDWGFVGGQDLVGKGGGWRWGGGLFREGGGGKGKREGKRT